MYPTLTYHTFELRLVQTEDGVGIYRLSKDADGKYYFISREAVRVTGSNGESVYKLLEELKRALELPIINWGDIK